jgi:hypothetical protein
MTGYMDDGSSKEGSLERQLITPSNSRLGYAGWLANGVAQYWAINKTPLFFRNRIHRRTGMRQFRIWTNQHKFLEIRGALNNRATYGQSPQVQLEAMSEATSSETQVEVGTFNKKH